MSRLRQAAIMLILVMVAGFAAGCGSPAEEGPPPVDPLLEIEAAAGGGMMSSPRGGVTANNVEIIEASPEDLKLIAEFGEDLTETMTLQNQPQNGALPPVGP